MDIQDLARATVEEFNRSVDRHVVEGEALRIEAEMKKATIHRIYIPSFMRRNTPA